MTAENATAKPTTRLTTTTSFFLSLALLKGRFLGR